MDRLRPQQQRPGTLAQAAQAVLDLLAVEAQDQAAGRDPQGEEASDEDPGDGSAGQLLAGHARIRGREGFPDKPWQWSPQRSS